MATLLNDVDWVESTVRYDDDGASLNLPYLGAGQPNQQPADFYADIEDRGEYFSDDDVPVQRKEARHWPHTTIVALNTILAVMIGVAQVALIWQQIVATPRNVHIIVAVYLLFFPILNGKIQQKAKNRRLTVYYRRMFVATALVIIITMGYKWAQYAPMERTGIYLLGMGFIMATFLVTVVAAVVLIPEKS